MKPLACLIFLLVSSAAPALADNPAMGPWDVWSTAQASRFITTARPADLTIWESRWQTAMRDAGICSLLFLADGSGMRANFSEEGRGCTDGGRRGPLISFPEFRRRMEAP